jgi:uncharacterized membrane protein
MLQYRVQRAVGGDGGSGGVAGIALVVAVTGVDIAFATAIASVVTVVTVVTVAVVDGGASLRGDSGPAWSLVCTVFSAGVVTHIFFSREPS